MFYKPKEILPQKKVRDLFRIRYRNPKKVPVQIRIDGNDILVTCYVEFSGDMMKPYHNRDEEAKEGASTFAHHIIKGIKEKWGKEYVIPGIDGRVTVKVDMITDIPQGQRSFLIRKARFSSTSYVSSPWTRWGWGFLTTLCPEAAMLNWSLRNPGRINMNTWSTSSWFESVAAHEFGHILGIGDAYDAHYRFFYEAPGTEDFMMNSDRSVAPQELLMVLRAHETGRMQYFPYKFIPKVYFGRLFKGLKRSVKRKLRRRKKA